MPVGFYRARSENGGSSTNTPALMKFPKLFEIARSVGVAVSPDRALTSDQRRSQQIIQDGFRQAGAKVADGVGIPWYESSTSDLIGRDLVRDARSGRVYGINRDNDFDVVDVTENLERRAAMSATGTTSVAGDQGGMTIGTLVPEIGQALRGPLVVEKLGARVIGGFRGNVNLPRASVSLNAEWLSENASASDTADTMAQLSLRPKRVTASMPVSDQLLVQGENIEAFLRRELMTALATEIHRVAIAGSGSGAEPTGILNTSGIGSVTGGTNGAAPTFANVCDLENIVTGAKADRGNLGWLVSPKVRKKLRQTFINGTGSDPIWSSTEAYNLLGYSAGVTTAVPDTLTKGTSSGVCSAVVFGEFSELFICLFGPGVIINAIRDTTLGTKGQTLLLASAYVDCGVRSPAAFAAMTDALTA